MSAPQIDLSAASDFQASRDVLRNFNSTLLRDEELRTQISEDQDFLQTQLQSQVANTCRLVRALLFSLTQDLQQPDSAESIIHPKEVETLATRLALCNTLWRTLQILCAASPLCQTAIVTTVTAADPSSETSDSSPPPPPPPPPLHILFVQTLTEIVFHLQPTWLRRGIPGPVTRQLRILVLTGFRTLCNLTTSNPETQAAMWLTLWCPPPPNTQPGNDGDSDEGSDGVSVTLLDSLISWCQEEGPLEDLSSLLCHLLYNCVRESPERMKELFADSSIVDLLRRPELYFEPEEQDETEPGAADDSSQENPDVEEILIDRPTVELDEWLEFLVQRMFLFSRNLFASLLGTPKVAEAGEEEDEDEVKHDGATLETEESLFEPAMAMGRPDDSSRWKMNATFNLASLFQYLGRNVIDLSNGLLEAVDFFAETMRFASGIITDLAGDEECLAVLARSGAARLLCDLLKDCRGKHAPGPAGPSRSDGSSPSPLRPLFITNILKAVAGLSSVKSFTEEFSAMGGIEEMLSRTHLDEQNPLSREWVVLAVRNMTHDNPEIQGRIASLQPQSLDRKTEDYLDRIGVKAELSDGRIRVHQVPKPGRPSAAGEGSGEKS